MSKNVQSISSIRLVLSAFAVFLCCSLVPDSAAFAQVNPTGGVKMNYQARGWIKSDDGIEIPLNNTGKNMNTKTCIFTGNNLFWNWTSATTGVESVPSSFSGIPLNTSGPRAAVPTRTPSREKTTPDLKSSSSLGCPFIHIVEGAFEENYYLKDCEGYYRDLGKMNHAEAVAKAGSAATASVLPPPGIECCHVPPDQRPACLGSIAEGQRAIKADAVLNAAALGVITKDTPKELADSINDKKQEERDAIQQCWDAKWEKIKSFGKAHQLAVCYQTVRDYFKDESKKLRREARDHAVEKVTENSSDTGHLTAGMSAGPGNIPSRTVGSIVLGAKGAAKVAIVAAQIADALETLLKKCGKIAGDYDSLDDLIKNISNQVCEATLGLIERQITQCIRIDFSGELTLPKFNLLTQCPINITYSARISPAGVTCVRTASGQSAIPVNSSANFSGSSSPTFLNASGLVESIFHGSGDCFQGSVNASPTGEIQKVNADGTITGGGRLANPRIPGVDCGTLDQTIVDYGKAILGIEYLPPAMEPASGTGWSISPVHDTGFPGAVPAGASQVSRCDYYVHGRIKRTAYVFGDGTQCRASFLSGGNAGNEIMASCYPNAGYVPVNQASIPEACMYRQGHPQPCLKEDLSGLDPAKVTALGGGRIGSSGNAPVSSIAVSVTSTGQLMSVLDQRAVGNVMSNGQVLTRGTILTTSPVTNFGQPALSNSASMRTTPNGVTLANSSLSSSAVFAGDAVQLAVDQTACARAFATHDSIGGSLVERLYPKTTAGINMGGTQVTTGSCKEFGTIVLDHSCCDPQVQDCTKPPLSARPICACDRGDALTRLIPAMNGTTPIFENDAAGNPTTKPLYICVDAKNNLVSDAKKTCCDAKASGEGAAGCGSPEGVTPVVVGAVQTRAMDTTAQGEGFVFTAANPLERCQDEAAMCVKDGTAEANKLKTQKPSPYLFLFVRPDKHITMLNGKAKQCCSSKWCNVCPQAYAGAYGLAKRFTLPEAQWYLANGFGTTGRMGAYPSMARTDVGESDPWTDLETQLTADGGYTSRGKAFKEEKWNMQLFRDGWPWTEYHRNDNSTVVYTGRGAWIDIIGRMVNGIDVSPNRQTTWAALVDNKDQMWADYYGSSCGVTGRPCNFPNFTINKSQPQLPRERYNDCAEWSLSRSTNPTSTTASTSPFGMNNSWHAFRLDMRTHNSNNVWGIESDFLWRLVGNTGGINGYNIYSSVFDFRSGPLPDINGAPISLYYYGTDMGTSLRFMGPPASVPYIGNGNKGDSRNIYTYTDNLSDGAMGIRMIGGSKTLGSVPDPDMYPIDYLNQLRAKLTPAGEEFEEIKLCSEAVPLCTDPKLSQYGNSTGSGGNGTGGLGDVGNDPFGVNNGTGSGSGSAGSGTNGSGVTIPTQCIGITDPALLAACIAQYGGGMGTGTGVNCDPVAMTAAQYTACVGSNGTGTNGGVPAQCVGLTGSALSACITQYSGANANGGLGAGGVRQGGIRNGGGAFTGGGNGTGTGGNGTGAGSGGNSAGGTGGGGTPWRPGTGSGTGSGVTPRGGTNGNGVLTGGGTTTTGGGTGTGTTGTGTTGTGTTGTGTTGTGTTGTGTTGGGSTTVGTTATGALF